MGRCEIALRSSVVTVFWWSDAEWDHRDAEARRENDVVAAARLGRRSEAPVPAASEERGEWLSGSVCVGYCPPYLQEFSDVAEKEERGWSPVGIALGGLIATRLVASPWRTRFGWIRLRSVSYWTRADCGCGYGCMALICAGPSPVQRDFEEPKYSVSLLLASIAWAHCSDNNLRQCRRFS